MDDAKRKADKKARKKAKRQRVAGAAAGAAAPAAASPPAASFLGGLLAPTTVAEFRAAAYEQKPLLLSSSSAKAAVFDATPALPTTPDSFFGIVAQASAASSGAHVMCMKAQTPTTAYATPYHAWLDGASLIVNRADLCDASLHALCRGVAASGDAPHAYCQLYATPAAGQAVCAHADDRDVFVVQLQGTKRWLVYGNPPVVLPHADEQVGKSDAHPLEPEHVAEGNVAIEVELTPGDALYIPRGFVHQAFCGESAPSVHATLALATSEWSVSRVAGDVVKRALDAEPRFRRALSEAVDVAALGAAVAAALSRPALLASLRDRVASQREMEEGMFAAAAPPDPAVWPALGLGTVVRKTTPPPDDGSAAGGGGGGGLSVDERIAGDAGAVLGWLAANGPAPIGAIPATTMCPFTVLCFAFVCCRLGVVGVGAGGGGGGGAVETCPSAERFAQVAAGAKPTLAYFTASWCGPCKAIKPVVQALAEELPGVHFLQIDVDELDELAQACNVSSMPTFVAFVGGKMMKRGVVEGADPDALRKLAVRAGKKAPQ